MQGVLFTIMTVKKYNPLKYFNKKVHKVHLINNDYYHEKFHFKITYNESNYIESLEIQFHRTN